MCIRDSINADTLLGMKTWEPEWHRDGVNIYKRPKEGHDYICTVDVAKGRGMDHSTFTVIDVSTKPFEQVATYRDSMISPMLFPDIINKYVRTYNEALVIIENNAEGAMVANQLHYDIEYPNVFTQGLLKAEDIGVTVNRKIKRVGCSTLKELLEENRLTVVDRATITELMTFITKGNSFEADRGYHDDMVMNLVLFSWFITLQYNTTVEQLKKIRDEIEKYVTTHKDFKTSLGHAVRVDKFSDSSIDMYVRCYTKTNSWSEMLLVKERLAIKIKEIVESNKASFAFPSTSIYVEKK